MNAPDLFPAEVTLETDQDLYTVPSFGPNDVNVKSGITYYPHSNYDVTVTPSSLPRGEHTITTVISDAELSETFESPIMVKGKPCTQFSL